MKNFLRTAVGGVFFSLFVLAASANEIPASWQFILTVKDDLRMETINLKNHPEFFTQKKHYLLRGEEVVLPANNFCAEEPEEQALPAGLEIKEEWGIDTGAIGAYLSENIAPKWDGAPQNVRIYKEDGQIKFEGYGAFGRRLNPVTSAKIIEKAILNDLHFATLDVEKIQPQITVEDEELKNAGIKELLSIGESDFSRSPPNRIHNIHIGAARFNGVLIPRDSVFSFNDTLGPVSAATGYKQELVIKGDTTVPDYGGGLCQVSTTTFRAALLAGLEIVERWPHAYAVDYYTPWGTDATIYLGGKNLQFKNDTAGAILIQTRIEGNNLYFYFYGTGDARAVALFGPYTGGWRAAPAARTEYTTDLPPGVKKVLSGSHAGFNATWFQFVRKSGETEPLVAFKKFFSPFEARGYFFQVGAAAETPTEVPDTI